VILYRESALIMRADIGPAWQAMRSFFDEIFN